jgi:hypothetical protein
VFILVLSWSHFPSFPSIPLCVSKIK